MEVDFVVTQPGGNAIAIECKWQADKFLPNGLLAFRRQYPRGSNYVIAGDVDRPYTRTFDGIQVQFMGIIDVGKHVAADVANVKA